MSELREAAERSAERPTGSVVAVRGVSKVFGSTIALKSVDLDLKAGEIHALCGGNGSGKSTLIKILCGVVTGDQGTIRAGDQEVPVQQMSPKVAQSLGIWVVHQDLGVFTDLSVAENMVIGGTFPVTRIGTVRRRQARRDAEQAIARLGISASPDDVLADLPVACRTQVAIARAIRGASERPGLVIFDEATASLPMHEVTVLHDLIRRLAQQGHSILMVSHRLDEVLKIADRVTILRDGQVTTSHRASELTEDELIEAILGKAIDQVQSQPAGANDSAVILHVSDLTAGPLRNVSFDVRSGEVVGVAGLLGSGRSELLRAICGDLSVRSGTVRINGRDTRFRSLAAAIRHGVVLIPEDRVNGAVFPDLSLDDNLSTGVWRRYWRAVGFTRNRLRRHNADLRALYRIKAPDGNVPMSALSGGNQQKAVLARWLRREPTLVLLDEPTQGVDVGARADIYSAIRDVTDAGGAAVVVTSDLEEMAQVVDRAIVLRDGQLVAAVPFDEVSAHRLSQLALLEAKQS